MIDSCDRRQQRISQRRAFESHIRAAVRADVEMAGRVRPGGFGAARRPIVLLLLLCAVNTRAQDGDNTGPQCSEDRLDLCEDLCTLDGKRPNPCPLECDARTGDCYDRCVEPLEGEGFGPDADAPYDIESQPILDQFDGVCANRLQNRVAESLVTDAFESTLRDPPPVSAGLSSVPFSMFRNGLLHTGRSDYKGPGVTVAGVPVVGWTFKTGGRIFSSPTLASDGTVYVGCTDGFVYGVQRSGVIKWKYPAGGPVVSTAAIGNPIGSDTTLFMGGHDGTLHAVSANYGTSKWEYIRPRLHLNGRWQLKATRPIVSSAALAPEGIVYIGADTALYALNAATGSGGFSGTIKWSYETRGLILGSPALDGVGRIYVGTMEGALYCLRQSDGEFLWRFDAEGGLYSSPALDGQGRVYVGSVDSYLYALDSETGEMAWKFRTNAAIYSSPAASVRDSRGVGYVFVGSTDWKLYAVRAKDGLLAWNQTLRDYTTPFDSPPPSPTSPPPTPTSGGTGGTGTDVDFTPGDRKTPYVSAAMRAMNEAEALLEAEGVCPPNLEQGTSEESAYRFGWNSALSCGKKGRPAVGVVSSPVLGPDGTVYVGSSDGYFYAINNMTGTVLWKMYTDGPIQSSAAIDSEGQLYFATDNGTIYQVVEAVPPPPPGQK